MVFQHFSVIGSRASRRHALRQRGRYPRVPTQKLNVDAPLGTRTFFRVCLAILFCTHASIAVACNVPVFRYALERWRPDVCEVVVFHDGKFSVEQEQQLREIEKETTKNAGTINAEVVRFNINVDFDKKQKELWALFRDKPKVTLPYVVIRTSMGSGELVNHWHGPLEETTKAKLFQSPIRRELSRRLLSGDSVVWLVLKSNDQAKNKSVLDLLSKEFERLSEKLEIPDGIGLPGSELYAEVPLFLKFTILEIEPTDPQEQMLIKLMTGFEPDAVNEPLLSPVFGRGRALEVIPAKQLDSGLIEDLTMFLCGACSCQVKERNPGFDLLLSTNWNQELYGPEGETPPPVTTLERSPNTQSLRTIPPGRKK